MLESLSWDTLSLESLNKSEENVKISFVETQLNVLHSVVRRAESARSAFRQCNAVDIMQKFRDVTDQPVCFSDVICHLPRHKFGILGSF